jgi:hypothetical protein
VPLAPDATQCDRAPRPPWGAGSRLRQCQPRAPCRVREPPGTSNCSATVRFRTGAPAATVIALILQRDMAMVIDSETISRGHTLAFVAHWRAGERSNIPPSGGQDFNISRGGEGGARRIIWLRQPSQKGAAAGRQHPRNSRACGVSTAVGVSTAPPRYNPMVGGQDGVLGWRARPFAGGHGCDGLAQPLRHAPCCRRA